MLQVAAVTYNPEVADVSVEIVPTEPEHLRILAKTIRPLDRREIESFGLSSSKALWRSYKRGLQNKAAIIGGEVAAVWGVGGQYFGSVGQPWLLTSQAVKKISALRFARLYQQEVMQMLEIFPRLENYVLAEYTEAVRLLDIVGFTLGEPEKLGLDMFRRFEKTRSF